MLLKALSVVLLSSLASGLFDVSADKGAGTVTISCSTRKSDGLTKLKGGSLVFKKNDVLLLKSYDQARTNELLLDAILITGVERNNKQKSVPKITTMHHTVISEGGSGLDHKDEKLGKAHLADILNQNAKILTFVHGVTIQVQEDPNTSQGRRQIGERMLKWPNKDRQYLHIEKLGDHNTRLWNKVNQPTQWGSGDINNMYASTGGIGSIHPRLLAEFSDVVPTSYVTRAMTRHCARLPRTPLWDVTNSRCVCSATSCNSMVGTNHIQSVRCANPQCEVTACDDPTQWAVNAGRTACEQVAHTDEHGATQFARKQAYDNMLWEYGDAYGDEDYYDEAYENYDGEYFDEGYDEEYDNDYYSNLEEAEMHLRMAERLLRANQRDFN